MKKTLCRFCLASVLLASAAAPSFAAGSDSNDNASQATTGTQLGSPQVSRPATGAAPSATGGTQYGRTGGVGPTGSTQPDAGNPQGHPPSGGGGTEGGAGGGTSSSR